MSTLLQGGHTETVLCVTSNIEGRIVSGGEGGQLCCWSLDGAQPQKHNISNVGEDVTSVCCSKLKPNEFYVACGQTVSCYDFRQIKEWLFQFEHNEDEINQIALNDREEYLAACDDSGQIKIFNLNEKKLYKTLRKHTNICSSVVFRPKRQWDLLSGGLDNMLLHWDFSRNRSICSIDMQDLNLEGQDPESYMVNPPFIYSVAVSNNGGYVACGTESALIQVFDSSKKIMTFLRSLRGHTSGVSQVHFPSFSESLLVSGGNDGKVLIWDAKDCVSGLSNGYSAGHANGHADAYANGHANGPLNVHANGLVNGYANGQEHEAENGAANNDTRHESFVNPRLIIEHGDKVNWLTSVTKNGGSVLIVADNSHNLTLYDILE